MTLGEAFPPDVDPAVAKVASADFRAREREFRRKLAHYRRMFDRLADNARYSGDQQRLYVANYATNKGNAAQAAEESRLLPGRDPKANQTPWTRFDWNRKSADLERWCPGAVAVMDGLRTLCGLDKPNVAKMRAKALQGMERAESPTEIAGAWRVVEGLFTAEELAPPKASALADAAQEVEDELSREVRAIKVGVKGGVVNGRTGEVVRPTDGASS